MSAIPQEVLIDAEGEYPDELEPVIEALWKAANDQVDMESREFEGYEGTTDAAWVIVQNEVTLNVTAFPALPQKVYVHVGRPGVYLTLAKIVSHGAKRIATYSASMWRD